jgi:hypothetical protein
MSVRLLDTRPAGLDDAFDEYRQRCMLLFTRAFRRTSIDEQKAFSGWLIGRYENSGDKPGFLHDAPLVRVARFAHRPLGGSARIPGRGSQNRPRKGLVRKKTVTQCAPQKF